MTALLAWLVFPIVATVVALGLGLLVEAGVRARLPGTLLVPLGFALLIGVTQLTTWSGSLAQATTPVVVVLAIAGLVLGRGRLRHRDVDRWAVFTAVGVFLVYLGPIVLSGNPGFGGYVLLGDTSIHLELAEQMVNHGATIEGLVPSSYSVSLESYFYSSYPTGSHTALGGLGNLVPADLAWLYHPFLAWMAGLTALALYELTAGVVPRRRVRALVCFVAAQPGLLYAFAMQGAIKEIATVATLATFFAVMPWFVAGVRRWWSAVPLAIAGAGALGAIDIGAAAWLAPGLALLAAVAAWRLGRSGIRYFAGHAAVFGGLGALLAAPTLTDSSNFLTKTKAVLSSAVELGNLQGPLDTLQVFGVWPRGDFRLPLENAQLYLLTGVVAVGVGLGLIRLMRGRGWAVLAFALASLIACVVVTRRGSPWVDAKALAIFAPVVLLLGLIGAASLLRPGRRVEGTVFVGVIAAAVLWTNALAYHETQVSNWPRLSELERLGEKYAGQGPTFAPEFEEFTKYFMREAAPTAGSEAYKPVGSVLVPNGAIRFGFSSEIGQFAASYLEGFRSILLRRSPQHSRPPAGFERVHRGRYYDVWQREQTAPKVLGEIALGDRYQPGAVPSCIDIRALAGQAKDAGARLAWVEAPKLLVAAPDEAMVGSPNWGPDGADTTTFRAGGPGFIGMRILAPTAGRYAAWAEASLTRELALYINDQRVGTIPAELSPRGPGQALPLGSFDLPAGRSTVRIVRGGGGLAPGDGSAGTLFGPISFVREGSDDQTVQTIAPGQWRSLCGRNLDWVEIVA